MIKVKDVAYVRFRAPDLDQMERFLLDFGLLHQRKLVWRGHLGSHWTRGG